MLGGSEDDDTAAVAPAPASAPAAVPSTTATTAAAIAVHGVKRCSSDGAVKKSAAVRRKKSFSWSSVRRKRG